MSTLATACAGAPRLAAGRANLACRFAVAEGGVRGGRGNPERVIHIVRMHYRLEGLDRRIQNSKTI
eukprot:7813146-Pyramimonas_sp.AAC.1